MRKRTLFEKIIFYLSVPKCVRCGTPLTVSEYGICTKCMPNYENSKAFKCSVCGKPYHDCSCVNEYLKNHYVSKLFKLFRYRYQEKFEILAANQLIYNIKRAKRTDIIAFVTAELYNSMKNKIKTKDLVVTSIPRSNKRKLKYGFDHSEKIAKALAKLLGVKYEKALKSKSKKAQKTAKGEERFRNAKFDYLRKAPDLKGKTVIVFDDIVTTGASMGTAAMLIKGLGARKIFGACLGIAYRDRYRPFSHPSWSSGTYFKRK